MPSCRFSCDADGIVVRADDNRRPERFDQVVIATHADQALRLLGDASAEESRLLGAFGYSRNRALLHSDPSVMPRRHAVWSSWNYMSGRRAAAREGALCVTYWMNRLHGNCRNASHAHFLDA